MSAPSHPVQGMPLLVLLDGEWNLRNVSTAVSHLIANRRLPPMVVAGVVNTDRGRESDADVCRRQVGGWSV